MTTPSHESLEQARAELAKEPAEGYGVVLRERATVIELRRQLAEALTGYRVQQTMLDSYQVDLATERQRTEAAEAKRKALREALERARLIVVNVEEAQRMTGAEYQVAIDHIDAALADDQ